MVKFLEHLRKWKSLYEVIGILLVFITSAGGFYIAYLSVQVSKDALVQAEKSLRLSEQSIKESQQSRILQEKEFKLRNRPYLDADKCYQGEEVQEYPQKKRIMSFFPIIVVFRNYGEAPATDIKIDYTADLNDKRIISDEQKIGMISKEKSKSISILLTKEQFDELWKSKTKFDIKLKVLYSGMLEDSFDTYQFSFNVKWSWDKQSCYIADIQYN
ncbi:MAG: hypothetical protein SWH54_20430 [Thermodesulfobacteriota bacterium]|nr:hypothetical protein [Thermodesulfobacteriota bacterium]